VHSPLHEPLISLCNSDKKRDIGFFTWLINRDGDEFLCENRLEEVYLREVLHPNSPDKIEVEECRVRFLNVVFIIHVRIITVIASISSMRTVSFLSPSGAARLNFLWLFNLLLELLIGFLLETYILFLEPWLLMNSFVDNTLDL
jgi:hypothetical protein